MNRSISTCTINNIETRCLCNTHHCCHPSMFLCCQYELHKQHIYIYTVHV